jgi:hypothetical protein
MDGRKTKGEGDSLTVYSLRQLLAQGHQVRSITCGDNLINMMMILLMLCCLPPPHPTTGYTFCQHCLSGIR